MGACSVLYTTAELRALDEKQRRELQQAIMRQLQTSPEIRSMLREKTRPIYEKLTGGKGKAPAKTKK
jgi:hypothetical protein